jgi:glycine cleavage system H protein
MWKGKIGVSNYAQEHLGDIVNVEMPEMNQEFEKSQSVATLESVKTVGELYTPVSGNY